jgi:hypothetical protein
MLENIIVFSVLSIIFLYQFALTIGYKKFNWKSKLYGPFWTQMATFLGIVFFITGYALSLTDIFFEPVKLVSNHEVFIKNHWLDSHCFEPDFLSSRPKSTRSVLEPRNLSK